ncbi:MAG: TfoX/Sxy family protein [Bacteroidota bacterium]
MPASTITADRIRDLLTPKQLPLEEKRLFGGHGFMVDGKLCIGTYRGGIMARVAPEDIEALCQREGVQPMQNGQGRPMKGYLFLTEEAFDLDRDLAFWVEQCLAFNPRAKASPRRRKKR